MSVTAKSWPLYPILFVPTRTKTDDSVTLRLKNYNFMLSPIVMDSKLFFECKLLCVHTFWKIQQVYTECQLLTVHLSYIIVRFALRSLLPSTNVIDDSNFNRTSSMSLRLQNDKKVWTENRRTLRKQTNTLYLIRVSSVG